MSMSSTEPRAAGSAQRCGFVALIGAPNAGKSTLMNTLIGRKISIVTPKVQTTRSRITGIALRGSTQLVFVDTPGIFVPRRALDRAMVAAAWTGAHNADQVVHVIDTQRVPADPLDDETDRIVQGLRDTGRKAVLALNKTDITERAHLLALAKRLFTEGIYSDVFMLSALTGDSVKQLADFLAAKLPEGPWLYPEDQVADVPLRLLAAEITREKAFLKLSQELPYATSVETEKWTEQKDGSVRIEQILFVQRAAQKAIVLGKGGRMIKEIGAAARRDLEQMLERRVHLFLFVKVRERWSEDPEHLSAIGLGRDER